MKCLSQLEAHFLGNTFKKKSQIDANLVKELFPDDNELYNRIKLTDKMNNVNEIINGPNNTNNKNKLRILNDIVKGC